MPATRDHRKATRLRIGDGRYYLVEFRGRQWFDIIELDAGTRIQDVDISARPQRDGLSWRFLIEGYRAYRASVSIEPGWYLQGRRFDRVGPLATRRLALAAARLLLEAPESSAAQSLPKA